MYHKEKVTKQNRWGGLKHMHTKDTPTQPLASFAQKDTNSITLIHPLIQACIVQAQLWAHNTLIVVLFPWTWIFFSPNQPGRYFSSLVFCVCLLVNTGTFYFQELQMIQCLPAFICIMLGVHGHHTGSLCRDCSQIKMWQSSYSVDVSTALHWMVVETLPSLFSTFSTQKQKLSDSTPLMSILKFYISLLTNWYCWMVQNHFK